MKNKISRLLIILLFLVMVFSGCGTGNDIPRNNPHILLITIDTLRRDHLGCYGYPRQTSPFIDRLAKEGVMFKHVITPQTLTAPSHASILTSLHPLTHGILNNRGRLDDKVQTIAEKLSQNGYYTIGVIGSKILSGKKNFSQGFDAFNDDWFIGENKGFKYQRIAEMTNCSLFKEIQRSLSQNSKKPLFIWLHYYDPHTPYTDRITIPFKKPLPFPPGDKRYNDDRIDKYDKEIRYVDNCVKEVYKFLKKKGLTKKLITCITADHGEEFGEHGTMYYHSDFYSETSLVPLIFHGLNIKPGQIFDNYVSTMDIAVTLMAQANLAFDNPNESIDLSPYWQGNSSRLPKKRNFLINATPFYSKSLQLIAEPFSYIMNLDYHYRSWYFVSNDNFLENRFRPVNTKWIETQKKFMDVRIPSLRKRELNFLVLRVDVKKNNGMAIKVFLMPNQETRWLKVKPIPNTNNLNVLFPVTALDDVLIRLKLKNGTHLENFRYGFISKKEFPQNFEFIIEQSNYIFENFSTQRKKRTQNELFNLENDIAMQNNLVFNKKNKPSIIQYQKMIYAISKYYIQLRNKLLTGIQRTQELSPQEKEMLKSLGYL